MVFDKATFKQLTTHVAEELIEGHLSIALSILDNLLTHLENVPHRAILKEQADTISADYQRLLHYMAEGVNDPSRASLHLRLMQKTFRILQDLRRYYYMASTLDGYTQTAQHLWENWNREQLHDLLQSNVNNDFAVQDHLFALLWTAPQLLSAEEQELRLFLCTTDEQLRCYQLSALTLSLLHYFDAAKMRLLIEYCSSEQENERTRAMLGVCITTQLHASSIRLYPTLREDLILLSRQPHFAEEATTIQHYICLYRETERLQERMEKEIIPTLIKVSQQRRKLGFDDMEIDLTDKEADLGINRKTQKMLESGMQEMARLFQEGMDVNLHTFTSLKGFTFFRTIGHWLAPFDTARPEVPDVQAIQLLPICDSDKYSVSMLYQHLSEEQREGMRKILDTHSELFSHHSQERHDEFQNVIQCLYRLLKRSPWASLFPNVFSADMMFIDNSILGIELRKSSDFLHSIGLTMLRHRHYELAERHLQLYAKLTGTDCELLLQLGRCAQEQRKFQRAISYYQQGCMLEPDNSKLLYRLQYCYAQTERYAEQLECLLQLEQQQPDDPKVLTETGLCLIQQEKWDEAARRFYKLEFKEQRVVPSMRAIAWCALRMHNYEEAQKYYTRILRREMTSATWEDYLNAGHTTWLQGDIKTAVALYTEYLQHYLMANPEAKDAMQPFVQDGPLLQGCGISSCDLQLMYDLISWKPQSESQA